MFGKETSYNVPDHSGPSLGVNWALMSSILKVMANIKSGNGRSIFCSWLAPYSSGTYWQHWSAGDVGVFEAAKAKGRLTNAALDHWWHSSLSWWVYSQLGFGWRLGIAKVNWSHYGWRKRDRRSDMKSTQMVFCQWQYEATIPMLHLVPIQTLHWQKKVTEDIGRLDDCGNGKEKFVYII